MSMGFTMKNFKEMFLMYFEIKKNIFIVIQLQLSAFSPHPSTPPQPNPLPSPPFPLPLGFVQVSLTVVPVCTLRFEGWIPTLSFCYIKQKTKQNFLFLEHVFGYHCTLIVENSGMLKPFCGHYYWLAQHWELFSLQQRWLQTSLPSTRGQQRVSSFKILF